MIKLIVSKNFNNVIGRDGNLPWHFKEDLNHFRKTTLGHAVIMGRVTYDSIPSAFRPLDGRINIVLSKSLQPKENLFVVLTIKEALALAEKFGVDAYIAGGESVYKQARQDNLVDEMIVSEIYNEEKGDVFFNKIDPEEWNLCSIIYKIGFRIMKFKRIWS